MILILFYCHRITKDCNSFRYKSAMLLIPSMRVHVVISLPTSVIISPKYFMEFVFGFGGIPVTSFCTTILFTHIFCSSLL